MASSADEGFVCCSPPTDDLKEYGMSHWDGHKPMKITPSLPSMAAKERIHGVKMSGLFAELIRLDFIGLNSLTKLIRLDEGEGVAARVLENLGADPGNIRTQVIRMVGESTKIVGAAGVGGGTSGSSKMPTPRILISFISSSVVLLYHEQWRIYEGERVCTCIPCEKEW